MEYSNKKQYRVRLNEAAHKYKWLAKILTFVKYYSLAWNKELNAQLEQEIRHYRPNFNQNRSQLAKLKKDMIYSRMAYLIKYQQYFIFDFARLSDAGRREYVGEYEKKQLTYALHEKTQAWKKFKDKYLAYQTFQKYYRREIIKIADETDKETFCIFVRNHRKYMLKAIDKAEGQDIFRIEPNSFEESALDALFSQALHHAPCIIEEIIQQDEETAKFHPFSVNTVRILTYRKEDRLIKLFAIFRIGCGGSHVDNAGAGGIAALIDLKTGIIETGGFRENGSFCLNHPDTGVQIIGASVPRWTELLYLVEELAEIVPEQKYVGWDLALTPDGWCMVEGNDRAMFTAVQMCRGRGIRKEIEAAFGTGEYQND